ncbi:MAG TPA: hypothetical protein VF579_03435, partial [Candidatus Methylomirabilis sp.]
MRLNLRGTLFLALGSGGRLLAAAHYPAAALGWLCYGELLAFPQIAGAALVCGGIAWIQRATA